MLELEREFNFDMKYFDELKYEEISEILETSVGGLKASYFHAVKKIEHCSDGFCSNKKSLFKK